MPQPSAQLSTTHESDIDKAPDLYCLGNWSSKTAWTIAYDEIRELVFLGSCGCVSVIDVSKPLEPKKVSEFKHSRCNTCALYYEQHTGRLYICDGISGLKILDLSDATQPKAISEFDTPGYASGVHVSGTHAYVADADGGLFILDVSNPQQPKEVGHYEMTTACCVFVSDNIAYVADLGLRIIDVSVASEPREISYYATPGVAYSVHVEGKKAYIADDWGGLRVIDVANPTYPKELGYCNTQGYAWDVFVVESLAYVASCDGGLQIIDVSAPKDLREVGSYDTPGEALSVLVSGARVYVAAASSGLQIYASALEAMHK
jgi:hypothetical protein